MPSLSLNIGLNNGRKLPFGGGGGPPPSGLPTATTNTITLQSGGSGYPFYIDDGAEFPKQDIGYFGDAGDYKLVWSGSRWELLGDNNFVFAYNTTSGQTTNYFPDQGNWFDYLNQPASLVFVGS